MQILDKRYLRILFFLEKYDGIYDVDSICSNLNCNLNDIIYLIDKKNLLKWKKYNVPSLDAEGRNFLANLRSFQNDRYATKEEGKKATRLSIIAIIISVVLGVAQLLISLLHTS